MSSSDEVERLRLRLDAEPGDDEARADLAPLLARAGDRDGASEAWYIAACGARRRGDEALFRERIRRCLEVDPAYPLVFTGPPAPPLGGDQAWARVLVAHPESRVRGPIARLLADRGYAVEEAATAGSARAALKQAAADLVLTAPRVVDGDAFAIASAARKARSHAAIVLLTCAVKSERIDAAAQLAPLVDEHLDRPLSPDRLLDAIRSALWRHRHAAPVAAIERHSGDGGAGPGWSDSVTRSALLVLAGYGLIFAVHATLASLAGLAPDRSVAAALAAPPERSLPPEVDRVAENALWVERTSTDTAADLQVVVTALDPALVAARVHRARRQGAVPGPASADEVRAEIDRLAPDAAVSFEVHLEARGEASIDPAAVARSLRLRAADRPAVAPSRVSPHEQMRIVREARDGGEPRTRALTLAASFPRAALGEASVYALSLSAGGREVVVFVPAPPRR